MHELIKKLKGQLIVSCQAYPGEPMRNPETMAQIAAACVQGGAAGIRCQGLSDISLIKSRVDVPIIGLWKEGHNGVYITPSVRHAKACIYAGSDIVAIDATNRLRPDGTTFADTVKAIREETLIMADCCCLDDVKNALNLGVDIIGTTLSGTVGPYVNTSGPHLKFLKNAVEIADDIPVICEGGIHSPDDAKKAIEIGAFAVVVGTAITHPTSITSWFSDAIK